eukprot:3518278-Rhodomonas_salina.1
MILFGPYACSRCNSINKSCTNSLLDALLLFGGHGEEKCALPGGDSNFGESAALAPTVRPSRDSEIFFNRRGGTTGGLVDRACDILPNWMLGLVACGCCWCVGRVWISRVGCRNCEVRRGPPTFGLSTTFTYTNSATSMEALSHVEQNREP